MGYIFISYSHKDKTYAHKLQRKLLEQGFEAWIDDRIDYGAHWTSEIEKFLRDCEAFILIMSPAAYESEWVQNELNLARKLKKPIFPLLLDGEEWWHIGTTQFVDIKGGKLPDTKFYVHLAEVSPRKWTEERPSERPNPKPHQPAPEVSPPGVSVYVNGDISVPIIVGAGNKAQHAPKVEQPKESEKTPTKPKTEIVVPVVVAVIGLVGVICAALIGALPWKDWLPANPALTATRALTTPVPIGNPVLATEVPAPLVTPAATSLLTDINDVKSVTMRLVPVGAFTMGSNDINNEKPPHTVKLNAFYIDIYEVTNARYKVCVDIGDCKAPINISSYTHPIYYGNSQFDNYPVIYVNWKQAKTYCEWRGARLPTEAEWEKAARGTHDANTPWGKGNYGSDIRDTTSVGSYVNGKSPYGMYDMAGNVWEWVSSLYQLYPYNADDGRENLSASGDRVIRGGAWNSNDSNVRPTVRNRYNSTSPSYYIGFRCARTP